MISVVVPTYNERDNAPQLLEHLASVFAHFEGDWEVVIVDDDSPDGTAARVRTVGMETGLPVRVIVRRKQPDLSRSVVRGIIEARGDTIVVMDADLQHPAELTLQLAERVTRTTPIAVATRYSDGGRIENWPLSRRIVSYGALLLAKVLIPPARGVSDPISGFFAVHAGAIDYDALSPAGYKILLEILTTTRPTDVAEVGFVFKSRECGESSLDFAQYRRFLKHAVLAGLRYRLSRFSDIIERHIGTHSACS